MGCAVHQVTPLRPFKAGRGEHSAPVIADRGDAAWVVVVHASHPPDVGFRFEFNGLTWEITRGRDLVRGFVARPVCSNH